MLLTERNFNTCLKYLTKLSKVFNLSTVTIQDINMNRKKSPYQPFAAISPYLLSRVTSMKVYESSWNPACCIKSDIKQFFLASIQLKFRQFIKAISFQYATKFYTNHESCLSESIQIVGLWSFYQLAIQPSSFYIQIIFDYFSCDIHVWFFWLISGCTGRQWECRQITNCSCCGSLWFHGSCSCMFFEHVYLLFLCCYRVSVGIKQWLW